MDSRGGTKVSRSGGMDPPGGSNTRAIERIWTPEGRGIFRFATEEAASVPRGPSDPL